MTATRREFTPEFKREALALLESSGRPLMQIATELGISPSMLRNWRAVRAGESDAAIAAALTAAGHGSPLRQAVLPSTVQAIRLRYGILRERRQSHSRRIPGCLTVPLLADQLGVTPHWIYNRIYNGTIAIEPDARTGLYLFPDGPVTLSAFQKPQSRQVGPPLPVPRLACRGGQQDG
nr:transposase [Microvirga vignae]